MGNKRISLENVPVYIHLESLGHILLLEDRILKAIPDYWEIDDSDPKFNSLYRLANRPKAVTLSENLGRVILNHMTYAQNKNKKNLNVQPDPFCFSKDKISRHFAICYKYDLKTQLSFSHFLFNGKRIHATSIDDFDTLLSHPDVNLALNQSIPLNPMHPQDTTLSPPRSDKKNIFAHATPSPIQECFHGQWVPSNNFTNRQKTLIRLLARCVHASPDILTPYFNDQDEKENNHDAYLKALLSNQDLLKQIHLMEQQDYIESFKFAYNHPIHQFTNNVASNVFCYSPLLLIASLVLSVGDPLIPAALFLGACFYYLLTALIIIGQFLKLQSGLKDILYTEELDESKIALGIEDREILSIERVRAAFKEKTQEHPDITSGSETAVDMGSATKAKNFLIAHLNGNGKAQKIDPVTRLCSHKPLLLTGSHSQTFFRPNIQRKDSGSSESSCNDNGSGHSTKTT